MSLWLNGRFWVPWIREGFIAEIKWTQKVVLEHMLPAIPDPGEEGQKAMDSAWVEMMSVPADYERDFGAYAGEAIGPRVEVMSRLQNVKQAFVNMSAVMLWHLVEQQILYFHKRQVLMQSEVEDGEAVPEMGKVLFTTKECLERLKDAGYLIEEYTSWSRMNDLRMVANAVKHGPGESFDKVAITLPHLLRYPMNPGYKHQLTSLERPASGEDLYLHVYELEAYFEAAVDFWEEFCQAIECNAWDMGEGEIPF